MRHHVEVYIGGPTVFHELAAFSQNVARERSAVTAHSRGVEASGAKAVRRADAAAQQTLAYYVGVYVVRPRKDRDCLLR